LTLCSRPLWTGAAPVAGVARMRVTNPS